MIRPTCTILARGVPLSGGAPGRADYRGERVNVQFVAAQRQIYTLWRVGGHPSIRGNVRATYQPRFLTRGVDSRIGCANRVRRASNNEIDDEVAGEPSGQPTSLPAVTWPYIEPVGSVGSIGSEVSHATCAELAGHVRDRSGQNSRKKEFLHVDTRRRAEKIAGAFQFEQNRKEKRRRQKKCNVKLGQSNEGKKFQRGLDSGKNSFTSFNEEVPKKFRKVQFEWKREENTITRVCQIGTVERGKEILAGVVKRRNSKKSSLSRVETKRKEEKGR